MAIVLDGKKLATQELEALTEKIAQATSQGYRAPCLAVVQVGEDTASEVYVARKKAACELIGIIPTMINLESNTTEATLLQTLSSLNADKSVDGVLLQLPIPTHIDKARVLETILPDKDVDGFHPYHLGRLAQGIPTVRPCTPYGIMRLLEHYEIPLAGKHAVILGRSLIVGKPMMLELCQAGATVTVLHSQSQHVASIIHEADIIISATGVQDVIPGQAIKQEAIVIDVGMHRLPDGKLRGDLDGDIVKSKASYYTPVPGGVGPMTVASLMQNTWAAYQQHMGINSA